MPRYFFDVENGDRTVDEVVIKNERRLTVVVRDESGKPVYRTEMAIEAGWLSDDGQPQVPAE